MAFDHGTIAKSVTASIFPRLGEPCRNSPGNVDCLAEKGARHDAWLLKNASVYPLVLTNLSFIF